MTTGNRTAHRLGDLLDALPDALVFGSPEVAIRAVEYDSRSVSPGALFVAVPTVGGGPETGGRRFLSEALAAGAAAVVLEGEAPVPNLPVPCVVVPDARSALGDLAAGVYDFPSRSLQLFAVTGTDGKTTTTYLLEQILAASGLCTGLMGTVETKIGDQRLSNVDRMTTPESLDVQRTLRAMVDAGVTHAALEASSHALALERLRGCSLAACAVTNITGDHLEFHGSWDAYVAAKTRLFAELGAGRPAILNRDDTSYEHLAGVATGPVIDYGLEACASLRAVDLATGPRSTQFSLEWNGARRHVELPFPGRFNVANALAAAGLALTAGLPLDRVAEALEHVQPPPGRLQRVEAGQTFAVFVDYAHTVNAFRTVIAELRRTTPGRLIAVFGAAGSRDRAKRPTLARTARDLTDYFIITNEDPFGEQAGTIISEIAAGLPEAEEGVAFERQPDRRKAIARAVELADSGDTVIILGKGHEQSIVTGDRKDAWSDVAVARQVLESRG